jgi:hypothetical protein
VENVITGQKHPEHVGAANDANAAVWRRQRWRGYVVHDANEQALAYSTMRCA